MSFINIINIINIRKIGIYDDINLFYLYIFMLSVFKIYNSVTYTISKHIQKTYFMSDARETRYKN